MKRAALAAIVVVVGAASAAIGAGGGGGDDARRYRAVFDNAFGLVEGGQVRVAGVEAGRLTDFRLLVRPGRAPKAVVEFEIDDAGFAELRVDATCRVVPQSLVGEYFVDCEPGRAPEVLEPGGTIPVDQTTSTVPVDLVNNIFRAPYRQRLGILLSELGTGLAGRPADLSAALRRAHPGLRETSEALRVLADQSGVLRRAIRDTDVVVHELADNRREVRRFVRESADVAETAAARRERLRQTVARLPGFLAELQSTSQRLGGLVDAQLPLLAELQDVAPDLADVLEHTPAFAEAAGPALERLGDAAVAATDAVREGDEEVALLREIAAEAGPTFRPLRQFLQTLDDRRRAIEDDPRAVEGAPPAPDPTHVPAAETAGFTGMEAFWSYWYWQTLSINGFDDVSHMLRAGLTISKCTPLKNELRPDEIEEYRECLSWLGPDQPGITTPDPTLDTPAARELRAASGRAAGRRGERRRPGEPEAGPLPGQPDRSQPQLALPPGLEPLVDALDAAPPTRGAPPGRDALPLLDFLLRP